MEEWQTELSVRQQALGTWAWAAWAACAAGASEWQRRSAQVLHRCLLHESPPNKAGASSAFWSAGIEYRTAAQAANGIARGRGASRQRTEFGEGFVDTAAVQPRDTSPPALPLHLARPGRGFCRNRSASIRSGRWLKVPRLPLQAQPGRLCERAWRWHWRSPVLTQSADVLQREVLRHLHLCAIYFGRSPSRLLDECEPSRGILRRSLLEAAAHLSVPVRQDGSLSAAYSIAMQLSNLPLGPCYAVAFPEHLPQAPSRNNSKQRAEMPALTPQQN